MKWFMIIFTLLCLTACSVISPEPTAHAGTDPAETKETNETVMEEPSSAVVLPEDIAAQAEVLTDHLIRFVMTPEWMEEPFEYTDENIFRFLVSLPTVQCPV